MFSLLICQAYADREPYPAWKTANASAAGITVAITAFSEGLATELWGSPVSVHVIHPGIIETELFSQPDNDESIADDIEALPASTVYDLMIELLRTGTFEGYVPDWFNDIASGKAGNMQGYLSGAAEYFAAKMAERSSGT